MAIHEIKIDAVEPFAEGQVFGEAGPYLRIRGTAKGELDPAAPQNRVIVDLDKAPRNARRLVEYETDFFILRPADLSRTNGVLVYDVTNRGRKRIFAMLDDAPGELKSVAYDTSVLGPQSDSPDVHYFLQKRHDLVRCDFHKRDQTSYYWCYKLVKAHTPQ